MKKITIPKIVTKIGDSYFNNSNKLVEILINNKKGVIAGVPLGRSYEEKAI